MAAQAGLCLRECRSKFYQELVEDLIAFAEHEFRQSRRLGDGATVSEHQESAARQIKNIPGWKGKKASPVPVAPPMPSALAYLWIWYCEIAMGLASNGMGPAILSWEALTAWCRQMRVELHPWEARALVRLGHVHAVVQSEAMAAEAKQKK
jgi:hypothetical protein